MTSIPSWPGEYPDFTGCLSAREMVHAEKEHSQWKYDHLFWCEGCDDCIEYRDDLIG